MSAPFGAAQQDEKNAGQTQREYALVEFVRRIGGHYAPVSGTTYPYSVVLTLLIKEPCQRCGIEAQHAGDSS